MNIDRINALADLIEKQPHSKKSDPSGFNMEYWQHTCGTPSCIAGWAVHMSGKDINVGTVMGDAQRWLGLNDVIGDSLFMANGLRSGKRWFIQPAYAAAVLRHLAATGDVDWFIGA